MSALNAVLDVLRGRETPDAGGPLVPPSHGASGLVVISAAVMALLAIAAGALALAADRVATRWSEGIAQSATVRVVAPRDQVEETLAAALETLRTAPGVTGARALDAAENAALLAPWVDLATVLDGLDAPRLIDVTLTDEGPDATDLNRRLALAAPGATYVDHMAWRAPLTEAAAALRRIGWGAAALTALVTAVVVVLATRATIFANLGVISTLRLLGATNPYIARAFVRRFTRRAVIGGVVGVGLGALLLATLPTAGGEGAFEARLRPEGWEWGLLALAPLASGLVGYAAARAAVRRALRRRL